MTLSIITATKPWKLSKGFELAQDGALKKLPGGNLIKGVIETRDLSSLTDLADILTSLTYAQALTYGIPIKAATTLLTRKAFAAACNPEGATTRTKESFRWPDGPGVMMLDYDPPAAGDPLDQDQLIQAIKDAAPGLATAAMLWWPSASSCIWAGAKELRGIRGQRLYIMVKDAKDIPRAGTALVERLWLSGHGHIEISKSGAMLERTLVDASVWQPSRLDFAGGAYCGDGLEQRRGDPVIIKGDGLVDTAIALPDLTLEERESLAAIKANAKGAASAKAEGVKEDWIETRVQEMVAPEDQGDPEVLATAKVLARQALGAGKLAGDFTIQVEIDGTVKAVSIGDILDNRDRYHGALTLDPLEPEYDGGRLVGRLFLIQARPVLYSFAHGGKAFKLRRAPEKIELVKGHTSEAATATVEILRRDPVTFDFGGQLALADGGRVHPLCEHGLAHHLGSLTQFWKYVKVNRILVPVDADPPAGLLKQIIALGERRKLKPLDGVITGPTIRLDGSVLDVPGYDAETRLLFDPNGHDVLEVPTAPTLAQANDALDTLLEPFQTFPFVDPAAKGALLAATLTAAVRPVLPTAPAFGFDAPIQGSGKTLLASCIGAMMEGRTPDVWPHTQGRDDEETRKRLFTALRTGGRALIWDNVIGTFDSASMAAFITADAMVDRVLGKSESIRIPNRAMLILTGNNMSLAGDLPRRVIVCRIDPETDQPFARQFDRDPMEHVLDNRMAMMAAACTLIRARFTHVKEPAPGRLASFEAWDDLVRQTVVWADTMLQSKAFGDPMDLVREAQAADPEADALFALLDALHDKFGAREFTAKDVQTECNVMGVDTPLGTAVRDIGGDRAVSSARSLGKVLKFREGRIVHGLRLAGRQDLATKVRVYRVNADITGFTGFNGFFSSHTDKGGDPFNIDGGETNPANPADPVDDFAGFAQIDEKLAGQNATSHTDGTDDEF